MMSTTLKSTTAMLMAMSLMQPLPSWAQSSPEADENPAGVEAETEVDPDASDMENAEAGAAADEEAAAKAAAEAAANAAAADALTAADEAAEEQTAPGTDADTEAVAAEEAEAQAVADEKAAAQAAADAAEIAADEAETSATDQEDAAPAEAEAEADAETVTEEETQDLTPEDEKADAEAVPADEEDTRPEPAVSGIRAGDPEACAADGVAGDAATACVETLSGGSLEPVAADTDADPSAEVTTETVTEETSRSSDEEFEEWNPDDRQGTTSEDDPARETKPSGGMSNLEKAGLLALGAAVVGAVVLNGQRVEANTGDRVVVVDENEGYRVLKDDDALLRQPGSDVSTQRFSDGSTRTNVLRGDGTEIITVRDSGGRVLRRVLVETDGREYLLFDDTRTFAPVVTSDLPDPAMDDFDYQAASDRDSLRAALLAADERDIGRSFSLQQVREINEVRQLSPEVNLQGITFVTASSAIQDSEAGKLRQIGTLMRDIIAEDRTELFLIEGYTDAVGAPGSNLLLSDRRAESVALALGEYFGVPTENMVVQGYGERFLKIATQDAERRNRRVAVRRITTLVR